MDCIDIIEIMISLNCVNDDLYDLVILFKYIIVMRNWIVLIWLFDPCFFLLWRNEVILICECPSDYLKIVEVVDVEDGEYGIERMFMRWLLSVLMNIWYDWYCLLNEWWVYNRIRVIE